MRERDATSGPAAVRCSSRPRPCRRSPRHAARHEPRRAARAIPAFYHRRPVVVVGELKLLDSGELRVSDDSGVDARRVQGQRAGRRRRNPRRVLGPRPHEAGRPATRRTTTCSATFGIDPEGAVAAPGQVTAHHRDRRSRAADTAAAPSIRTIVLYPVAVPRSEGDGHRPVRRAQPARRSARRAGAEPLRFRAALGGRGNLGDEPAAARARTSSWRSTRGSTPGRWLEVIGHAAAGPRPAVAGRRSRAA